MTDTHIQNSTIPTPCKTKQFPGASHFTDSRGKVRWRYRKDGFQAGLGRDYGSGEFVERYNAATQGIRLLVGQTISTVSSASRHGSFAHIVDSWYKSDHFTGLGTSTQYGYRQQAENLKRDYGPWLVSEIQAKHVSAIMDTKADVPNSANHDLRIIRFVLDEAKAKGLVRHNAAREVLKFPVSGHGFHTWTEEEIQTFYSVHKPGTPAYTCMTLMLYTGAGRKAAAALGRTSVHDGRISYRMQKVKDRAGILVDIKVHPVLQDCISKLPVEYDFFLQTQTGGAHAPGTLGNYMRDWCDEAGLPKCSSHGLRKAFERRLAEVGMSEQEVAAVMGYVNTTTPHPRIGMGVRVELADKAMAQLRASKQRHFG